MSSAYFVLQQQSSISHYVECNQDNPNPDSRWPISPFAHSECGTREIGDQKVWGKFFMEPNRIILAQQNSVKLWTGRYSFSSYPVLCSMPTKLCHARSNCGPISSSCFSAHSLTGNRLLGKPGGSNFDSLSREGSYKRRWWAWSRFQACRLIDLMKREAICCLQGRDISLGIIGDEFMNRMSKKQNSSIWDL